MAAGSCIKQTSLCVNMEPQAACVRTCRHNASSGQWAECAIVSYCGAGALARDKCSHFCHPTSIYNVIPSYPMLFIKWSFSLSAIQFFMFIQRPPAPVFTPR